MRFEKVSDEKLNELAKGSARAIRLESVHLIFVLAEIARRHLFAKYASDSLFDYCVRTLKLSEASAARHVNASRLVAKYPGLALPLREGSLNLTTLSMAQVFFRQESDGGAPVSTETQIEILRELKGLSSRKVEIKLSTYSQRTIKASREHLCAVGANASELKLTLSNDTVEKIDLLKENWSHQMPSATYADVIAKMADLCVAQKTRGAKQENARSATSRSGLHSHSQPVRSSERVSSPNLTNSKNQTSRLQPDLSPGQKSETPAPEFMTAVKTSDNLPPARTVKEKESVVEEQILLPLTERKDVVRGGKRTRYISSAVRMTVWMRDGGSCGYTNAENGERCGSRHQLELDHEKPFAHGGKNTVENLRLRCRAHNQWLAVQNFGHSAGKFRRDFVREIVAQYVA